MAVHELTLDVKNLRGYFSRDLDPVLTVDPGDTVELAVPNAGWFRDPYERIVARDPANDTGRPLAGPIEVRGATAGQTLEVRIDDVTPGEWGVTYGDAHRIDWELAAGVGRGGGRAVRLAPFLAARAAVDGMLDLMQRELGLDRPDALAFASVVVDLRVTQVANQALGVHAVLRDDAFL